MSNLPVLADQQARNDIEQKVGINLLVEAGAGSGKTEALARRMAAAIASGPCQVENMAAVTFTRKAAAELRGRFQLCLERRLLEENDNDARERIRTALARLERLFTGTIHAFCAHLLRERPVEAGIAPGFEELDEIENNRMLTQAWRDYLDQERAAGSAALQELLDAGILPQDLDDSFRRVCLYPEVDFPLGTGKKPDAKAPWKALEAFWLNLCKLLPQEIAEETTCTIQTKAREFRWRFSIADRTKASTLTELLKLWDGNLKVVQKRWADNAAEAKQVSNAARELVESFQESTVQPYLAAWRQYVYRLSLTLLLEARTFASNERRRVSKLNYEDLLQEAARLLRDRTDVRIALQQKYQWLFVDEFQDTDPIQAEVIFWLASAESAKHWSEAPLRPGALFIVGDPKQSIYRFRRADIDTYQLVRQRIQETGGQILSLTTSFRSTPSLCSWVNRVFPDFFPPVATPAQPAFQSLDPKPDSAPSALSLCHLTTLPPIQKAREVATYEAQVIARYVWSEVHTGRRQWKDFLILTRKKELLPVYQAAFEQLRIPVDCSGGSALDSLCGFPSWPTFSVS